MLRILMLNLILLGCFSPVSAQTEESPTLLKLVTGESLIGHLPQIQDGTVSLDVASVKREFRFDQITELSFDPAGNPPPTRFEIRMVDDSMLYADTISIIKGNAQVAFHDRFAM